ncbi:MAG TPA: hypothetical protein VD835_13575, partial [Pyrinomonadaceae bacterium]|nr:hypothetical protein [Pyrinomonadaceae bacterium]
MKFTAQQKTRLSEIGSRLLSVLEEVANHAYVKRTDRTSGHPPHALAGGTNTMVDGSAAQMNLSAIDARDRENLVRLEAEPFVARVVVRWEGEDPAREETLYVSRVSVAGMSSATAEGKLATYGSVVGRLAEFEAGQSITFKVDGREREAYIRERVMLRPVRRDGRWDAINDSFEFDEPWKAAVESVLRLLEHTGRTA